MKHCRTSWLVTDISWHLRLSTARIKELSDFSVVTSPGLKADVMSCAGTYFSTFSSTGGRMVKDLRSTE